MQPYGKPKPKKEMSTEAKSQLEIIRDAIDKIFQMKYSNLSFEELYRTGYNLVINQNGDALYETVKSAVAANLTSMIQSLKITSEPVVLLNAVKDVWQNFNVYISVTSDILMYMERNYISRNHLLTVIQTGSKIFRETVLEGTGLLDRLHVAIMSVITKDRNGEYVEKGAVKEMAAMLVKIG
jgi:cullin 3